MTETMPTETGISLWRTWLLAMGLTSPRTGISEAIHGENPRTAQPLAGAWTYGPCARYLARTNPGSEHDMSSSPTSGPERRTFRDKGLARLSAVTLGAAAASALGAAGIVVALHSSATATNPDDTTVAPSTSTNPNNDNSGPDSSGPGNSGPDDFGSDGSSPDGSGSQLQPGVPPSNSDNPPGATSGGS